jgi:hypothetical protein
MESQTLSISKTLSISNTINNFIDKNYIPLPGDILSNNYHSLMIVEKSYNLEKRSYRINKNYNEHMTRYEWLEKVIRRKEIIWDQHKNDLKLFPDKNQRSSRVNMSYDTSRVKMSYNTYCYFNDYNQFKRLYGSKYRNFPNRKVLVTTGVKKMIRISHATCSCTNGFWGYSKGTPLSSLITKKSVYKGNIHALIRENDLSLLHEN